MGGKTGFWRYLGDVLRLLVKLPLPGVIQVEHAYFLPYRKYTPILTWKVHVNIPTQSQLDGSSLDNWWQVE